jgi:1-acyl-sn-glycerol-3-phosphate acyltransferase
MSTSPAGRILLRSTENRVGTFGRLLGRFFLFCLGWKTEGTLPSTDRALFIANPHTTNWDAFIMVCVAWAMGMKLAWLTKEDLTRTAFWRLARAFGAIPIYRDQKKGQVVQVVEAFKRSEKMWLAVAPSGTRKKTEAWKSGFYYMAFHAQVPVILGFLDYRRKVGGTGPSFLLTGDVKADMDKMRAFYKDVQGKYPENDTPVLLPIEGQQLQLDDGSIEEPRAAAAG